MPIPTIPSKNTSNEQTQKTLVEITQSHLNRSHPTSKPIPVLSMNLLAIGCSDGAIRFFSSVDGKVVKSVRGPNGRADPVVRLVSVNPRSWGDEWQSDGVGDSDCVGTVDDDGDGDGDGGANKKKDPIVRILSVCASGMAYIWELQVEFDSATGSLGGGKKGGGQQRQHANSGREISIKKFKIRPPLAMVYGLGVGGPADNSSGGGGTEENPSPKSPVRSNSAASSSQAISDNIGTLSVEYDPDRQLLLWTTTTRTTTTTLTVFTTNISTGW